MLSRQCKETIPRTGIPGKQVNCFSVSVDRDGDPYLLVEGLDGAALTGLKWDGSRYSQRSTVPLDEVESGEVFLRHYYGLHTIIFTGIPDLAWSRLTGLPYVKLAIAGLRQVGFNRTQLVTKRRIELLRVLIDRECKREKDPYSDRRSFYSQDLMSTLYTERWILHPEGTIQHRTVRFYLDSLCETGELEHVKSDGLTYRLKGEALKTIEEFEEQERKHSENVSMQRRMFWLSVAIVLLALIQAGVVKMPVLVDLSFSLTEGQRDGGATK